MRYLTLGARLWRAGLELLYPARCCACDALCDDEDDAFCVLCALTLEPIEAACPWCGLPSPGDSPPPVGESPPCLQCLERRPLFSTAWAPYSFGGALARAIRRLKWSRRPELGGALGRLLTAAWKRAGPALGCAELIVPVPLHPRRLREREFNQAAVLARGLGAALAAERLRRLELAPRALARVRDTPSQTGLGREERLRNVRGAFATPDPARVRGRGVLLVDDVLTTGATADACALALYDAGATEVAVLTLGRAVT
jgi:ComF family protein